MSILAALPWACLGMETTWALGQNRLSSSPGFADPTCVCMDIGLVGGEYDKGMVLVKEDDMVIWVG